jgi:hypothetical protein
MATFNYFKAKEQGFSDEEIVAHLAEKEKGLTIRRLLNRAFLKERLLVN